MKMSKCGNEVEFEWYDQEDHQWHYLYLTSEELKQALNLLNEELKIDLYKIPYATLEMHLKTRKEEAKDYLEWM